MKSSSTKSSSAKELPADHWLSKKEKAIIHTVLMIIACSGWIYSGNIFAYIAAPLVVVSAIILVFTIPYFKTAPYRYYAAFISYLTISPFFLAGLSFVLTIIFSSTINYRIGFDIQTPKGISTIVNKVTIEDSYNPIEQLKGYYSGSAFIKGKANAAIINDKLLITLLSPAHFTTFSFLKHNPSWAHKPTRIIDTTGGIKKYILSPKTTPVMVCLDNINDPKTMRIVTPEQFGDIFGPGYSFVRAWITFQDVTSTIDTISRVTWWDYEKNIPLDNFFPFKALKLNSDMLSIHERSTATFLRM